MAKRRTTEVDTATIRLISVLASADTRTVRNWLQGKPVRGMVEGRIADACGRLGIDRSENKEPSL